MQQVKHSDDINDTTEVTDDENDIDAMLEENEEEDPDWSGEALQEDEDEDDDVEDLEDTDDPEWGPKEDDNDGNIVQGDFRGHLFKKIIEKVL